MDMKMQLRLPPTSIEGVVVHKEELDRYFLNTSVENLVLQLRQLRREGCFDFQVTLDRSYLARIKDRATLAMRADVLEPITPFGFSYTYDDYGIGCLHTKIETGEALSESDIALVAQKLPGDMVAKYLGYKLFDIDWDVLEDLVSEHPAAAGRNDSYDRVEFNGLAVDGVIVSFRGRELETSFQHREVIRFLISRQGGLCYRDEFFKHSEGILARENYVNPEATLRKLISAVRSDLQGLTGRNCIVNTPGEGWRLSL